MNGEGHVFTGILTVDFLYLISLINSYPFFTFRTKQRFFSILSLLDSNALTLGYRQKSTGKLSLEFISNVSLCCRK